MTKQDIENMLAQLNKYQRNENGDVILHIETELLLLENIITTILKDLYDQLVVLNPKL